MRAIPGTRVLPIATLVMASVVGLWTPVAASMPVPAPSVAGPDYRLPSHLTTDKHPKLDSHLLAVASATRTGGTPEGLRVASERDVAVSSGRVRVVVTANSGRSAVRDAIQAVGGLVEAEYADLVQALLPPGALRTLAELSIVRYVRQPSLPVADSVVDEGVGETNAIAWQSAGLSGAGVKVGVIDAGFIGYTTKQASGDLPASLTTADFGCGGVATGTDHGTAVAEIVYKMAPDVQLYLICMETDVNLGQAKDYALSEGITIVNHSLVWFNTSRGDGSGAIGTPDAIVADARANGILWVNAAGNHAQRHWSGTFSDPNANFWHQFTVTDELDDIGIAAGGGVCVFLKWDDWPASSQDYDVYLFRLADLTVPVSGSENFQNGSQPPTEAFCYTNTTGVSQAFGIAIRKFAATTAPRFDLFVDVGAPQYVVAAGSITEPGSSPHAMAAGAICWQNDALEPFSSRGPTIDGRTKPDIAGQDRTSSSVYGMATGCTGGFAGTSASAPHVAGAAALVAEANPASTPAQLQSFLEGHALDLGTVGKDNSYGSGRLWLGTAEPHPTGATFIPLTPARILDTRFGNGLSGPFSALTPRTFQVTGQGGVPLNATAVTGNLTVTSQSAAGFVYLGPYPLANPPSSTLNFPLGDTRANGVTVALSPTGTLSATNGYSGTTHLVFDVTGYFVPDDSGATFVPLTPARLLDTRFDNGLSGPFSAGVPRTFQVTGLGGVPLDATAVTGNLTVTSQTHAGFVFLGPDPVASPTSSTLNFPVGDTRANGVTVALSVTGTLSATTGYSGTAHLVFDVTGYFVPDDSGATFVPLTPARLLDSRFGNGLSGPFNAMVPRTFQVTGRGGVPLTATGVTGNLTVTSQTQPGFVFLGPDPVANPTSSTLNFPKGDTRANGVTVALSLTGTLSATYGYSGTTHLVFDVTGYFVP
ncbi:MAG: S8 family serine peptidase [Candidatus Limnocylindria bacterium]